jgi:hypothetical protein
LDLVTPAEGTGPDLRSFREVENAEWFVAAVAEHIERHGTLGEAYEPQTFRLLDGHIFEAVDRAVDLPVYESFLDLLYEKPLATNISEGFIEDTITSRTNLLNLDFEALVHAFQRGADNFGLRDGE